MFRLIKMTPHVFAHAGCPNTISLSAGHVRCTGISLIRKNIIVPASPDKNEAEARA